MGYTITEMKGEEVFENATGRWQYVRVDFENGDQTHRYFHEDCDCMTDEEGRCILCRAKAWQ